MVEQRARTMGTRQRQVQAGQRQGLGQRKGKRSLWHRWLPQSRLGSTGLDSATSLGPTARVASHSAASAAAPPPPLPQFPWMDAASPSAADPWAVWPSAGAWQPGGVNSLAHGPSQNSSLALAFARLPVATHNMFDALIDNVGSDGQKSLITMALGEVAKITSRRPRRGETGI